MTRREEPESEPTEGLAWALEEVEGLLDRGDLIGARVALEGKGVGGWNGTAGTARPAGSRVHRGVLEDLLGRVDRLLARCESLRERTAGELRSMHSQGDYRERGELLDRGSWFSRQA